MVVKVWHNKRKEMLVNVVIHSVTGNVLSVDDGGNLTGVHMTGEVTQLRSLGIKDKVGVNLYEGSQLELLVECIPNNSSFWRSNLWESIKDYGVTAVCVQLLKTDTLGLKYNIMFKQGNNYLSDSAYYNREAVFGDGYKTFTETDFEFIQYLVNVGAEVVGCMYEKSVL